MITRVHGSWPSPITSELITSDAVRLSQPRFDGGDLYWLEGRPAEGGRQVVVRAAAGRAIDEVTPGGTNVRNVVHEYGGGDYCVSDGSIFYCDMRDHRIHSSNVAGREPVALTPAGAHYADLVVSPEGRWLIAVEERPGAGKGDETENRLVAIPLPGGGTAQAIVQGFDFVSFPCFRPDGRELAFTAWNHPQMPWDGTRLFAVAWDPERGQPSGAPRKIAGGADESIFQPSYSPAGRLTFVSDRSGWWNLYQQGDSGAVALCPREMEFGVAQWVFGMSTYAHLGADAILCTYGAADGERLARLDLASGALRDLDLPFTAFSGIRAEGNRACFIGASSARTPCVCSIDLTTGELREHRSSTAAKVDESFLSKPERIVFPTDVDRKGVDRKGVDGEGANGGDALAHAYLYRPVNPDCRAAGDSLPPLLVKSHGGPTAAASASLDLRIQYWTSRGFAVADVDYRGSTGYGRAYRMLLRGNWGVSDVEDCVNVVRALDERGEVDPQRAAISGGSAGGYTTLCALTFHDVFRAGASHYGIGDLEALVRDTHKFESRYVDGLVGPYPECRDLYVERSPIHFTERLSCPVVFFQGLEDRVVPPNQAEAMVAALAARGIPYAYVPFEGEQHGFRRAENIRTAIDGELYFYAQVFGFDVSERPPVVEISRE